MMHGRGKSDSVIVAMKPANNAEQSAAELVEQRAGTEGNAGEQSTRRTQCRERVSQALDRIRLAARQSEQPTRLRVWQGASPCTVNCLYSDG
jgi:hypothetical protein